MATGSVRQLVPASGEEVAAALRSSAEEGVAVRPRGGATKLGWGIPAEEPGVELSTGRLRRVVEHNEGDLTAILEAGLPLAEAQRTFAAAGQMLALDPPLGPGEGATVGGVFATADAGPLRHRYGAPRDLIVGVTVALSDGTVARAGGRVIKNVAGYDLAKLLTGSFGTLGVIVDVSVRLHPRPRATVTARADADHPDAIARAAATLSHSPLEQESLDVRWSAGRGAVLARFGGAAAADQARAAVELLAGQPVDAFVVEADDALWAEQRAAQRAAPEDGAVVRVSGRQTQLPALLRAVERLGGSLVGRAALAVSWVALPVAAAVEELRAAVEQLRAELAPSPCVVLDAPAELRAAVDPWHEGDPARLALSARVKQRFDPAGVCNPGIFVGGI